MAYTYDEFVTQANKTGLLRRFDQSDLQIAQSNPEYGMTLLGLYQDKNSASTPEQRALVDETISQLRKNMGVMGQLNDAQKQLENTGSFAYSNETAYRQALADVNSMPEFSYDQENDPVYQSMRQTARREGQRAAEDTLARASVGTGGVASSYAVAAAQQAANNYTGALADAVPTLYQRALEEHQGEEAARLQRLKALSEDKATELEGYNDRLKLLYGNVEGLQKQLTEGNNAYVDALNKLRQDQGTLYDADKQLLLSNYPDGVADADVWQSLVNRYGETQLQAAGIKPVGTAAIPAETRAMLQELYPNGIITNPSYWNLLLASGMTEADLLAAGYRLGTATKQVTAGGAGGTGFGKAGFSQTAHLGIPK